MFVLERTVERSFRQAKRELCALDELASMSGAAKPSDGIYTRAALQYAAGIEAERRKENRDGR
jgi:hypothetical protein